MPFTTVCPNCDARLTAPDTVRGKKVKCKKCDEAFVARPAPAPADDDDEPPARPARSRRDDDEDDAPPRKPIKARRPVDEDDDEDDAPPPRRARDDEDDAPRPKKKGKGKKKKQSGSPVLLIVLVAVGALVLIGGAVGVYFAFIKEDKPADTPVAKGDPKGPPGKGPGPVAKGGPAGGAGITWIDYTDPKGTFSARLPAQPVHTTQNVATPGGPPITAELYQAEAGGYAAVIVSGAIPGLKPGDPVPQEEIEKALDEAINSMGQKMQGAREVSRKTVEQNGRTGREVVFEGPNGSGATARVFFANARIWNIIFAGKTSKPDQVMVDNFFNGFELK